MLPNACCWPLTIVDVLQELGALGDGRHGFLIFDLGFDYFFLSCFFCLSSLLSLLLFFRPFDPLTAARLRREKGELKSASDRKQERRETPPVRRAKKSEREGGELALFFFHSLFSLIASSSFFLERKKKNFKKSNHGRPGGGRLPREAR